MIKVAFQGTKGAYSELALKKYFKEEVLPVGLDHSDQVCEAVKSGEVALGILPVENSIVGNVDINTDLLYKYNFFVIGEIYIPIQHCLLALPGVNLSDIESVHSHPVALEQCREFLKVNNMKGIPDFDTAGASVELVKRQKKNEACISSRLCSEYYDLEIISDDIQQVKNNFTRFHIFVAEENIPESVTMEKTSIAFSLKHKPGALLGCLQIFADHGINLSKIESRPIPENPFMYIFYVDFIGSLTDENVTENLRALKEHTTEIKVLGSYPQGKVPL